MSSIPNHYETLKVPQNASAEQIKASYRELMLKFHPDKNPPNDPVALEISQKINAANDILGDEQKRREYDKELRESSGTSTTSDGSSNQGYTNFGILF
uniref:J domain-containing protein n=1 Tax=Meloidogyne incognita TaxID=6306 RepID=A0A914LB45_MELIC